MITLTILSCTDRPESNAWSVASHLGQLYRDADVRVNLQTLCDFPTGKVAGGRYDDEIPEVDAFNKKVLSGDGLVLVVPEYNGGFPGILKLFFDYLPFPEAMERVPVALVGEADGYFGALRSVEHLQDLLIYRKAHIYPERVFLPRINSVLDDDGMIADKSKVERLRSQAKGFAAFVRELQQEGMVQ